MRAAARLLLLAWIGIPVSAISASAQTAEVPSYVGSEICAACHAAETEVWRGSHHAQAWTPTLPANVLGDFDDAMFEQNGVLSRFFRDGDNYVVETDGPDGQTTSYPVHSVVGIEPLQQYLLETEPGRLQSSDVVWDTENRRWYHLYPDQELYGGQGLHWTGPYKNWNARCAECHATDFQKNYSPVPGSYQSTQSEIGVGCEACHGPGEAHVAWANGEEDTAWDGLTKQRLTIDIGLGGEVLIQQCATCHARREPFGDGNPIPGTPFHDSYRLSTLRDGVYHADGQILNEVYVYGSFLQSRMYAKGVTCNDCHEPHAARLRDDTNGICTQCHSEAGNTRFPSLTLNDYDTPAHHFHEQGSEASQCKSCHMIERNYMVVDGRRDHSFRIPRPDLSLETRSPNACTDCHTDKSSAWAAAAVESWYPESEHRGSHFGQALAAGRDDLRGSTEQLADLALSMEVPGIARATALEMLGEASSAQLAERVASLLDDADPMVRAAAVGVQSGASLRERTTRLEPLLSDPVKAVRLAAVREFLALDPAALSSAGRTSLQEALQEWQTSLLAKTDFPETQLVLGGIGLTSRNFEAALSAFAEATLLDPQMEQAWVMRIRILAALGNSEAARSVADQAIEANPDSVALYLLRLDLP